MPPPGPPSYLSTLRHVSTYTHTHIRSHFYGLLPTLAWTYRPSYPPGLPFPRSDTLARGRSIHVGSYISFPFFSSILLLHFISHLFTHPRSPDGHVSVALSRGSDTLATPVGFKGALLIPRNNPCLWLAGGFVALRMPWLRDARANALRMFRLA